jgi:hypothetical protein
MSEWHAEMESQYLKTAQDYLSRRIIFDEAVRELLKLGMNVREAQEDLLLLDAVKQ